MRATVLMGLDCSDKDLAPFRLSGAHLEVADRVASGADAALLFGGDGTIHRHLEELHALRVPVLIVPAGSGNDFATAVGIRSVKDSLAAWKKFVAGEGSVREIDLGVITPTQQLPDSAAPQAQGRQNSGPRRILFCCVGGAGLDSDANRRANAMPRWQRRRGGYMLAAVLAILGKKPMHARAYAEAANGEPLLDADEAAEFVAFANAPAYGDGLLVAPGAKLDDGKLDIVYVRKASRLRLLKIAPTILRGTHIGLPEVWFARAAKLHFESQPPRMIYADGEPACETPVDITVIQRGLRVIA